MNSKTICEKLPLTKNATWNSVLKTQTVLGFHLIVFGLCTVEHTRVETPRIKACKTRRSSTCVAGLLSIIIKAGKQQSTCWRTVFEELSGAPPERSDDTGFIRKVVPPIFFPNRFNQILLSCRLWCCCFRFRAEGLEVARELTAVHRHTTTEQHKKAADLSAS